MKDSCSAGADELSPGDQWSVFLRAESLMIRASWKRGEDFSSRRQRVFPSPDTTAHRVAAQAARPGVFTAAEKGRLLQRPRPAWYDKDALIRSPEWGRNEKKTMIEAAGQSVRSPYPCVAGNGVCAAAREDAPDGALRDVFTPSTEREPPGRLLLAPKVPSPPQGNALEAAGSSTAKRIVVGLLCGLSIFSAASYVAISTGPPAQAETVTSTVLTSSELAEAQRMGLSRETAARIKEKAGLEATLRSIPSDVAGRFKGYNPRQRAVMYKDITGKTWLGPVAVNNREAFVNGSVAGVDVFSRMDDSLDAHVKKGRLTAAEAKEMKDAIPGLKVLTAAQRNAIATVIEWECGSTASASR